MTWARRVRILVAIPALALFALMIPLTSASADVLFFPNPVSNAAAAPGDGEITVTWDPAAGGVTPTHYFVSSRPSSASSPFVRKCTISDITVRTCTFYANNGQQLDIEILAVKVSLGSDFESQAVTLEDIEASPVPDPPTITEVSFASPGGAGVTWTRAPDMPQPTTRTRVVATPGGLWCESEFQSRCGIGGLTNGTEYSFSAYSYNVVGESAPSTPVTGTPFTTPAAPTNVQLTATGVGSVQVAWDAPAFDGGRAITGYIAQIFDIGNSCNVGPTVFQCDFTGLTVPHVQVGVLAINAAGGDASTNSSVVAVPLISGARKAVKNKQVELSGITAAPAMKVKVRTAKGKKFSTTSKSNRQWRLVVPKKKLGKGATKATAGGYTTTIG